VRPELQAIVDELLAASEDSREVHLDAVGEAIGARAITTPEIEAIMDALDAAGRKLVGPSGGAGEDRLKTVIATARVLGPELGRKPTVAEIAARSGLGEDEVRHALALVKVMQR
jgi:DNA-directed RNA polymerase sigma subunit (sigma70/sigma32)